MFGPQHNNPRVRAYTVALAESIWPVTCTSARSRSLDADRRAERWLSKPNLGAQPNGYSLRCVPGGRSWGSTSAIHPSNDGNIWVAERCGTNSCVGSDLDPVLLFDTEGNLIRSFGGGMIAWPHGLEVDAEGNVWVADAWAQGAETSGHTVLKFSPQGELLMTIGTPGVAGSPPEHLDRPSDVLVAPNGEIYIVDSHGQEVNRIHKYTADGTYLESSGTCS